MAVYFSVFYKWIGLWNLIPIMKCSHIVAIIYFFKCVYCIGNYKIYSMLMRIVSHNSVQIIKCNLL